MDSHRDQILGVGGKMSNAYRMDEAQRSFEHHRELVFSMVADQDKLDDPLVVLWQHLGACLAEIEILDKHISYLQSRTASNK